jgi:hypothetical protein
MAEIFDFETGRKIYPDKDKITASERIAKGLKHLRGMFQETTKIEAPELFNPVDSERHHERLEAELADILNTD